MWNNTSPYHLLPRPSRCIGGKENGELMLVPASGFHQRRYVSSAVEPKGKLSGPSDPFLVLPLSKKQCRY